MPWHIGKSEDCPPSKPYAVIKDSDGSVAGCHETESKAKKQLAALYSSERKAMPQITALPIKAEQVGTAKWRVLAIPFGGPFKGRDMDGEFFSPKTDIKPHWFAERPVLWHHGMDETKDDPEDAIGTEGDLSKESDGWWADMWLDRGNRYWQQVSRMLAAGKVYGSSGALGHVVRKAPDGEILVWPHIEQTLTTIPANPFARIVPVKALRTAQAVRRLIARHALSGRRTDHWVVTNSTAGRKPCGPRSWSLPRNSPTRVICRPTASMRSSRRSPPSRHNSTSSKPTSAPRPLTSRSSRSKTG
jgi:hypothetical protein